jgi:hypothetical protein
MTKKQNKLNKKDPLNDIRKLVDNSLNARPIDIQKAEEYWGHILREIMELRSQENFKSLWVQAEGIESMLNRLNKRYNNDRSPRLKNFASSIMAYRESINGELGLTKREELSNPNIARDERLSTTAPSNATLPASEINIGYFREQMKKFSDLNVFFYSKLRNTDVFHISELPQESSAKPSIEEVHKIYHAAKEFKKLHTKLPKNDIDCLDQLMKGINAYCKNQFDIQHNIVTINEGKTISRKRPPYDNEPMQQITKSLLSKDPEVAARKISSMLKNPAHDNRTQLTAERLEKLLYQFAMPEDTYKIAKIAECMQKGEKKSFMDNIRYFCKTIAGLFNEKYKVKDSDIKNMLDSFVKLDAHSKNRDEEMPKELKAQLAPILIEDKGITSEAIPEPKGNVRNFAEKVTMQKNQPTNQSRGRD